MWQGVVVSLHRCPRAFLPMSTEEEMTFVAGQGIEGDRYLSGAGFYSNRPEIGRQATLIEMEALEAIERDYKIELKAEETRRNVAVRGVPLNHLVGRRFRIGPVLLEATRLSTPCKHIEEVTGKPVFDPMVHRSGLNTQILEGGVVRIGDLVVPA